MYFDTFIVIYTHIYIYNYICTLFCGDTKETREQYIYICYEYHIFNDKQSSWAWDSMMADVDVGRSSSPKLGQHPQRFGDGRTGSCGVWPWEIPYEKKIELMGKSPLNQFTYL